MLYSDCSSHLSSFVLAPRSVEILNCPSVFDTIGFRLRIGEKGSINIHSSMIMAADAPIMSEVSSSKHGNAHMRRHRSNVRSELTRPRRVLVRCYSMVEICDI